MGYVNLTVTSEKKLMDNTNSWNFRENNRCSNCGRWGARLPVDWGCRIQMKWVPAQDGDEGLL